jgi:hypothetical protein
MGRKEEKGGRGIKESDRHQTHLPERMLWNSDEGDLIRIF